MGKNVKKHRKHICSDIPYARRLQLEQVQAVKDVRDRSAKAIMLCQCIALHELYGIGYKRLVRFSLVFKDLIDEFYNDVEVGIDRARRRMASHGIELSEDVPLVEPMVLNHREQQLYKHAVQASYLAHLVGLIAANETFVFGKPKMEAISCRVAELTDRYNEEGEGFLLEEMEKLGFPIIDGKVTACLDDNDEPITYKKWLEGNNGQIRL